MNSAVKPIKELIENKKSNLESALSVLNDPLDNTPDEVKKMRELQAAIIRGKVEICKDLLETIKALHPNA